MTLGLSPIHKNHAETARLLRMIFYNLYTFSLIPKRRLIEVRKNEIHFFREDITATKIHFSEGTINVYKIPFYTIPLSFLMSIGVFLWLFDANLAQNNGIV